jgi:hypothetical protein
MQVQNWDAARAHSGADRNATPSPARNERANDHKDMYEQKQRPTISIM